MAIVDLVMPKMGESITEATILRWHKKVGDAIKMDETILDIATDKVDSEVPSTTAGVLKEILYNVNDIVPVGAVLARIDTEVLAAVAEPIIAPVVEAAETIAPVTTAAPIVQEVAQAPQPEFVPFVPQGINTGGVPANNRFFSPLVLNIANSEGLSLSELERIIGTGADGRVSKKDVLQYIADKRAGKIANVTHTVAQPSFFATAEQQVVVKQNVPNSFPIPEVGIETTSTNWAADKPESIKEDVHEMAQVSTESYNAAEAIEEVTASAAASAETAVDLHVETPVETPTKVEAEQAFSGTIYKNAEIVEMDRMRKLIAKHMVNSKATSPHVTSFAEADVTNMVIWRTKVKEEFEKREGTKITFTPMFIECVLNVMKRYPIINSSVDGDKIIMKKDINIGMATALPNGNLIVPVIKNANEMSFVNLTKSVNTLASNAREGKLKANDVTEGTFTLTNVGTFGSIMGTPIINQPQVAILAVGEIKKRPVVIETEKGDFIGIRHMMYLSLSYDHRIIDGSIGASFLSDIAKEMEAWDVNRQLKYVVKEWYVE
jgi:2-oxoglutarate dehydrogenase E2 component (dihydrolipoamide succinyltransferase)